MENEHNFNVDDSEVKIDIEKSTVGLVDNTEFIFHNDAISLFNQRLYSNIFTDENIVSKKKSIKIGDDKIYGYFLEKNKELYFSPGDDIKLLPFQLTAKPRELDYKSDVFKFIEDTPTSITIPAEKRMTLRELSSAFCYFQHTNKLHQRLYAITSITAYSDRINARCSTEAGFGKDSFVNIIGSLVDSTSNIYGATFAKLEFSLRHKLIILNELGNLKKEAKMEMQEFLLHAGAYFNKYLKRTRRTNSTQEEYDISRLSLLIFYNLPEYYVGKAQEYFDQIFTPAVVNRFIPFVFKGRITTPFEKVLDVEKIVDENEEVYKNVIATLNYYRQNPIREIKYEVDKSIEFSHELKRYERTFNTILKYVSEYSETQEEFNELSLELYKCYKEYEKLLETEKEET